MPGSLTLCRIFYLGLSFSPLGLFHFLTSGRLVAALSVPGSLTLYRIFYLGLSFSPLGLFHLLTSGPLTCGTLSAWVPNFVKDILPRSQFLISGVISLFEVWSPFLRQFLCLSH